MMRDDGATIQAVYVKSRRLPALAKPNTRDGEPKDVISYKGRVFEVHPAMVDYLASQPETLDARIDRAINNGMTMMNPDGMYGCVYCAHYAHNLANQLAAPDEELIIHNIIENSDTSVRGCGYAGTEGLRWARAFRNNKTGKIVMAQRPTCVVHDATIAELAERGHLDEYAVQGAEFNFPTLAEIIADPSLAERYEVKLPLRVAARQTGHRFRGLVKRILG